MKLPTLLFLTFGACLIFNQNPCSGASITIEGSDDSGHSDNGNLEKIPVRARKTGGGRRNRVESESAPVIETIENHATASLDSNVLDTNKDLIPVRARKAGGGGHRRSKPEQKPKEDEKASGEVAEYSNESKDDEEKGCKSENEFYHIRSKRCVPLQCYFGRDVETGQCFDRHGGLSNGNGRRRGGGGSGYRYKANHKTFGLGRFGIRAGGKKGR